MSVSVWMGEWMDGWVDGWMDDGWMDGWMMDGWMDGCMDGQTSWILNRPSFLTMILSDMGEQSS